MKVEEIGLAKNIWFFIIVVVNNRTARFVTMIWSKQVSCSMLQIVFAHIFGEARDVF